MIGALWLPGVGFQIRRTAIAARARDAGTERADQFHSLLKTWRVLGWPAFPSSVATAWPTVTKPNL